MKKSMKKICYLTTTTLLVLLTTLTIINCGPKQYAKGDYIDANKIILRSDKFVESDLQIIAERLSNSLVSKNITASGHRPRILMSLISNSTDEHIDMKSLSDKIKTNLFKSGKLDFINGDLRKTVNQELEYNASGFVDPDTAKVKGHQLGADYLVSGNITSIKQPVGREEIVYYKVTLELTDLNTNMLAWTDDVELKKQFKKKHIGN